MLVKEGHKGSYLLGGVVQIVLAVILIALTVPLMLSGLGIDTSVWLEFVNKIKMWVGGKYIFGAIHGIVIILFIITVLSIFFRKSGASFFVKLSTISAMFIFVCKALKSLVFDIFEKNLDIMSIFSGGIEYLLLALSIVWLILGFVFQTTVSRNNEHKANLFLFSKSIVWIVLLAINFVVPSILSSSNWLSALFGYNGDALPYFLCWYFLLMGIFQLISSPELINPQDSKFSTGTQPPVMPVAYIPVQPVMVDPFTPVMPNNPALMGRRQGLESEENVKTPNADETITQGLAEPESEQMPVDSVQEMPQQEAQSEYVDNQATMETQAVEGDTVSQGLTPPEGYAETETLEQIRERNSELDNLEDKTEQKEEVLGRELGAEATSKAEIENQEEPKEPEQAQLAEPVMPVAIAMPVVANALEEKPKARPMKKRIAKPKTEPIKKAEPKKETVKKVTKTAKPKAPAATKKAEVKKEKPAKEKAPKQLSQNEKLKEIDKIIKTLSSPRKTSRTRKTRKDEE